MAMAGIFGLFTATYYWFPLISRGRLLSERLGRWHFWLTLYGAYNTFLPMSFTGLAGQPRHYAQLTCIPNAGGTLLAGTIPLNLHITVSAFILASAQLIFLWNLLRSLSHGPPSAENPWLATTLEWHPDLTPDSVPDAEAEPIIVHRTPCHYPPERLRSTLLSPSMEPRRNRRHQKAETGVSCF
jgi:cytochrome c oxidase subunit 1